MALKKKYLQLLGKRCLPLVTNMSASFASSVLHGVNDMHRACHMDNERVHNMCERARRELRKQYKEQKYFVWAVKADGTFTLLSEYGYEQDNVSRSDFRLIN